MKNLFEATFLRIISEEMISGSGGAFGTNSGSSPSTIPNKDSYATDNANTPFMLGAKIAKSGKRNKKNIKVPAFSKRNLKFK